MKFLKSKKSEHITTEKIGKGVGELFFGFLLCAGASAGSFLLGGYNLAITFGFLSSAFTIITILSYVNWKSRIGNELQCKIAGVKFEDYCTCKFHLELRKDEIKEE